MNEVLYKINILLLVLFLWCIPWWIYNRYLRRKDFNPMGQQVLPTPKWLSCAIPYVSHNEKKNKCENVKIDGWTIGHICIYATLGMVLPSYWSFVLFLSLGCEIFEYIVGWRARWLLDPMANLFGYMLGHLVFLNFRKYPFLHSQILPFFLILGMLSVLYLNRPSMIPHGSEFY